MSNEKTIRMPSELADKWLAALRSGEYKKGRFVLQDAPESYCCLGVLQCVADGAVERLSDGRSRQYPTMDWISSHHIVFLSERGDETCNPYLPAFDRQASDVNDHTEEEFAAIADAIESSLERVGGDS